jgi:GR25 family glycosyltransferase involved in LPS biosynthesis
MRLFDRFDKVYLINLDRRQDRLENFKKEVVKFDLGDFERFSAYDGNSIDLSEYPENVNPGVIGLLQSNLKIIQDSKKNNYKKILIIEDDCYFTEEVTNIDDYFKVLPEDWDLLYMGGNHNTHWGCEQPLKINDKIIKLHHTFTTHLVGINETMFNTIESILLNSSTPIDVLYSDLQKKHNTYSFTPAIALQSEGFSDIENTNVDYKWLIN